MAMKIKGITIELNADTSGLEKALKGINKSLSDTQKDLKAVDKALKMDPKNLELIEQKERLLGKAVDETTQKLKALKEAQANIKMDGTEDAQRQYDALTREISSTEANLRKLNTEQQNFSKEANEARTSATGFGAALDTISEKADKVAQATAAMSAAAATALAGMAGIVVNASKFADEMLTVSQQTGLSTDALQKMEYAAEQVDVPMETIISSIRKMKGHLDDSESTWQRLGVQVKDQSGQYRDIESIFFDVVQALGQIENETERDTVAMELFGRSADEMAGIIDDGGKHLRELGREAESLGVIVSEDDLEKLGQFNDLLEGMKSQLKGAAAQAAVPILQAMTPVVKTVSDAIKKFAEIISNMDERLVRAGIIILSIIALISPVATIISSIASGLGLLINLIPTIVTGIQMINVALTALAANPYALAIGAAIVALVALAAAVKYCVDNWDTLGPAVDRACDSMVNGLKAVNNSTSNLAKNIKSKLHTAFEGSEGSVAGFAAAVTTNFKSIPQAIVTVSAAFLSLLKDINTVTTRVTSMFQNMINDARRAGANIINAFTTGVRSVINSVTRVFQQLADSIKGIFRMTEMDARYSGQRTGQNYAEGYNQGRNSIPLRPSSLNPTRPPGSTPMSVDSSGPLINILNELNETIMQAGKNGSTNVTVELVGSAKNIFDTVNVQNSKMVKSTGYHALA